VNQKSFHGKPEPGDAASEIAATTHRRKQFTSAPVEPGKVGNQPPEFIRPADARKLFGLSRTYCYLLIGTGKIQTVSLRRPGAKTGIRLIHFQSLKDFLTAQMEPLKS
jgi:hypothetical protein